MADGRARYGTPAERLARKTRRQVDGCWVFTGSISQEGYGRLWYEGRMVKAHRLAYELAVGAIPPTLILDHLCRNRACVNPGHLEPVTHAENILRGVGPSAVNARKDRCGACGSEYVLHRAGGRVRRDCPTCHRRRTAASYEATGKPNAVDLARVKTVCVRGHDLTDPIVTRFTKDGHRRCRLCQNIHRKANRDKAARRKARR